MDFIPVRVELSEDVVVKAARAASLGKSMDKLNGDLTALSYLLST